MNVFADDYENISELDAGSIGLIAGLNHTMTGDTLVETEHEFQTAKALAAQAFPEEESGKKLKTDIDVTNLHFSCFW